MRILMVNHLPWARELGGARPQYELAASLGELGHEVDHYSLDDAFTRAPSTHLGTLLRRPFRTRAVPAIRSIASRYDVIDANQGDLPCSKRDLGFDGLLVVRSNGLISEYRRFERLAAIRWRDRRGSLPGRVLRQVRAFVEARAVDASFKHADLIVVPNPDERDRLECRGDLGDKIRVTPLGVSGGYLAAVRAQSMETDRRLAAREVVFIGTWDVRKGSEDWPAIMRAVLARVGDARFRFLGTHREPARVLGALGSELSSRAFVVPTFPADELPSLLVNSTVGALPSYIEAFGLGVLEQLAAGVPTIAYDVPGPRHTLEPFGPRAVTPAGDVKGFAARLVEVLQAGPEDYRMRATLSRARAEELSWNRAVAVTATAYEEGLARLGQSRKR